MATGIVRFFNAAKGFGLIAPDLGGPALFVHQSELKPGVKKLTARDRVDYEIRDAEGSLSATNIRVLTG